MSLLEWIFLLIIFSYIVYVILWLRLDCNVQLWYKEHFGVPASSLRKKVVWITGASSGIGRGLALSLARHGVRLILSARRVDQLNDVRNECIKVSSGLLEDKDVLVLPMDMLNISKHQERFEAVLSHFGQIDILVNNAGRSQRAAWDQIDIQVDRDLFELDVFSVMHLSRILVRYFNEKRSGYGHIAATSSIAGIGIAPFSATYCGAKHALNAYFMALKLEYPKIDVTVLAPGPVATDFLAEAFTGDPYAKYGQSTADTKRISAERCGDLFAVALANKLSLAWCALFPVNFLAYAMQNAFLSHILFKFMSGKTMSKIREGKL